MDKTTNQELFKQALVEGVNRRIDRELAACEEEVVFSRRHIKAMNRIVKGKTPAKPINRKMVAILVAAAILLLAGCAIIYRDEIRGFITDFREFFVKVTFDAGESESRVIDEVYELTYIPDGYVLEKQNVDHNAVQCIFKDSKGNKIKFIQQPLDNASFAVDIEQSSSNTMNIGQCVVYYQRINSGYYYIWNDGAYALKIHSTQQLSNQDLELIINGIKTK